MIIETATRTGQRVQDVALDSFALTMYVWAECREIDREAAVTRLGERTDLAGLVAVAFHQPQDLQKMETRYLKAAGRLSQMFKETRERLTALAQEMAQATPVTEE